jgi:uncharacterized membrane protein
MTLTALDMRRWTLAASGAREMHGRLQLSHSSRRRKYDLSDLLVPRIENTRDLIQISVSDEHRMMRVLIILGIVPLIYGGLNLAGLSYAFPSQIERVLWIVACGSIIAIEMPAAIIVQFGGVYYELGYFLFIWVGVARLYLIVESFCSLRSVLTGLYVTVDWLSGIPHL